MPSSDTLLFIPRESWVSKAYDFLGKNWEDDPRISMAIWPLYSLGSSSMWLNPLALLVTAMVATMRGSSTIEVVEVI